MTAVYISADVASEQVRFILLAYGIEHAFRVLCVDEIAHEFPHIKKEEVRSRLDQLAEEELVTRFSGRYCFNKIIPDEILRQVEENVTRSGTIKSRR